MLRRFEITQQSSQLLSKSLQKSEYNIQNYQDSNEKFKKQINELNATKNNQIKRQKANENTQQMLIEEQILRDKENIQNINELAPKQRSNSLTNSVSSNNIRNINLSQQQIQQQKPVVKTAIINQISEFTELVDQLKTQEKLAKAKENFIQDLNNSINIMHQEYEQGLQLLKEKIEKVEEIQTLIKNIASSAENEVNEFHQNIEKLINQKNQVIDDMQIEEKKYDNLKKSTQQSDFVVQQLQQEADNLDQQIQQMLEENQFLENQLNQTIDQTKKNSLVNKDYKQQMEDVLIQKKDLNNVLQELKGNIRVYCRIRPFLQSDSEENISVGSIMQVINETNMLLLVPMQYLKSENNAKEYRFNFEHIFDQRATQQDIFNELSQLIQSLIDGFNVCIFAYGQTGSGKTYTIEGVNSEEEKGILQRSVELILSQVEFLKQYGWNYKIYISFQEIYMEQHRDLVTNFRLGDKLNELTFVYVTSMEDFLPYYNKAKENRKVGSTMCNDYSSRSHCIFQLKLLGENQKLAKSIDTTLNLIDLAGSERVNISKAEGQLLEETKFINKSLTSLGDVITALISKEKHIPFRNSKLTYVLNPFLGDNSKVLMLLNLSPATTNFHQSLCSLRFGDKVSCVKLNKKQGIGLINYKK